MSFIQISVFLENKIGRLAEVVEVIASNKINIKGMSIADTKNFGVLRLVLDDHKKAASILEDNGFTIAQTKVTAIAMEDTPGALHKIMEVIKKLNMNIEYMYAIAHKSSNNENKVVIVFRFDDENAKEKLKKENIEVIDNS